MKILQNSINQTISERDKIWQNYDRAVTTNKDLIRRFSNDFADSSNSNLLKGVAPLTPNKLPPEEIVASIDRLITNLRQ